jgi:hypothetical protein
MFSGRGRPCVMIVDSRATIGVSSRNARATFSEKRTFPSASGGETRRDDLGMDPERSPIGDRRPLSICTIGDLILDVVVLPKGRLVPDSDTPATIRLAGGGQAANVAAWASALGAGSRLICKRGTDACSELAAAELARRGVEICGPVAAGPGGVVVSIRDAQNQRTMASDRGVASLLDRSELDPSWVRSCDVLHVSGYCLLREPMAQAAIEAARHARRVTVDLASAHDIELLGAASPNALRPSAPTSPSPPSPNGLPYRTSTPPG